MIVVDAAATDPKHGKAPADRSFEELRQSSFVLLDKPAGPTSHQVAAWVRSILGVTRAGHGGTLDPNATGLLLIALGEGTRALGVVEGADKRYVGHFTFHRPVDAAAFRRVAAEFTGPVLQVPPKKSAVRRVRRVRKIYQLRVIEAAERDALVDVTCEAGTYIRTLAHDVGLVLGVGANLRDLRRTGVGPFRIEDAPTLTDLRDAAENAKDLGHEAELKALLHPIEDLLDGHSRVVVKDSAVDALCHGAPLLSPGVSAVDASIKRGDEVALVTLKGEAVAVARARLAAEKIENASRGVMAVPTRVLMRPSTYPKMWRSKRDTGRGAPGHRAPKK